MNFQSKRLADDGQIDGDYVERGFTEDEADAMRQDGEEAMRPRPPVPHETILALRKAAARKQRETEEQKAARIRAGAELTCLVDGDLIAAYRGELELISGEDLVKAKWARDTVGPTALAIERHMVQTNPRWDVRPALMLHIMYRCLGNGGAYEAGIHQLADEVGCSFDRARYALEAMKSMELPFILADGKARGRTTWVLRTFPAMAAVSVQNVDRVLGTLQSESAKATSEKPSMGKRPTVAVRSKARPMGKSSTDVSASRGKRPTHAKPSMGQIPTDDGFIHYSLREPSSEEPSRVEEPSARAHALTRAAATSDGSTLDREKVDEQADATSVVAPGLLLIQTPSPTPAPFRSFGALVPAGELVLGDELAVSGVVLPAVIAAAIRSGEAKVGASALAEQITAAVSRGVPAAVQQADMCIAAAEAEREAANAGRTVTPTAVLSKAARFIRRSRVEDPAVSTKSLAAAPSTDLERTLARAKIFEVGKEWVSGDLVRVAIAKLPQNLGAAITTSDIHDAGAALRKAFPEKAPADIAVELARQMARILVRRVHGPIERRVRGPRWRDSADGMWAIPRLVAEQAARQLARRLVREREACGEEAKTADAYVADYLNSGRLGFYPDLARAFDAVESDYRARQLPIDPATLQSECEKRFLNYAAGKERCFDASDTRFDASNWKR